MTYIPPIVQDYDVEVGLGNIEGVTTWSKFGYNADVDVGEEVIAEFGGAFDQKLDSGETLNIVSDSTDDDSAGTGVRQLVIFGVDENWDSVTEVIALDGTTTVTTTNSFLGINRMTIFTSGSSDSNVGKITATASSSGNIMATMPAGEGTTQQCIFYVPAGHIFETTWLRLSLIKTSGGGAPSVEFKGYVYSDVVTSQFEVFREDVDTDIDENIDIKPVEPFQIGEKSVLWFTANPTTNNTSVKGRFSGKLISTT